MNKMKKQFCLFTVALLVLSVMPVVFAAGAGGNLGGSIGVEEFIPLVFQCGGRVITDDSVQPWRVSDLSQVIIERNQQYLFEGERYSVDVLVFDKNKVQSDDVTLALDGDERCTIGCSGVNNTCKTTCEQFDSRTINCVESYPGEYDSKSRDEGIEKCNARIDEERLTRFDPQTMKMYTCTVDILDSEHMYGIYDLKAKARSGLTDQEGEYAEVARWFINPVISLSVNGGLDFSDVRPGTSSYSTINLKNTAEGGVILDMFVTGKDWPSSDSNLGRCQLVNAKGYDVDNQYVNYLPLGAFRYYSENGAYSTRDDLENDLGNYGAAIRDKDSEGYINLHRQINAGFEENMFDSSEVIQAKQNAIELSDGSSCSKGESCVYPSNLLYPGSVGMSLTFRLNLPEPCYGNFESQQDGSIFFWGEAI